MGRELARYGLEVIGIEHVDQRAAFEVDDSRAVIQPFAVGSLIHTDDARADQPGRARVLSRRTIVSSLGRPRRPRSHSPPPSALALTASARLVRRP